MNRYLSKTFVAITLLSLVLMTACDDVDVPDTAFEPQSKNLEGAYKITKATRNGVDITDRFDFSAFRLAFQTSSPGAGTYTVENKAPFVIQKNGSWKFDDPVYPVGIGFTNNGEPSLHVAQLTTPVIYDKPQLNLKFSPGCSANTYEYTLTYVTP